MLHNLMVVYFFVLFLVLIPGQVVTLPSESTPKLYVNMLHALVFAVAVHLTHRVAWKALGGKKHEDAEKKTA